MKYTTIMKHSFCLLLLLVAGLMSVKADNIVVDGTTRSYNVYAPSNLGENRPGCQLDAEQRVQE